MICPVLEKPIQNVVNLIHFTQERRESYSWFLDPNNPNSLNEFSTVNGYGNQKLPNLIEEDCLSTEVRCNQG